MASVKCRTRAPARPPHERQASGLRPSFYSYFDWLDYDLHRTKNHHASLLPGTFLLSMYNQPFFSMPACWACRRPFDLKSVFGDGTSFPTVHSELDRGGHPKIQDQRVLKVQSNFENCKRFLRTRRPLVRYCFAFGRILRCLRAHKPPLTMNIY
jgi:hypothetical protein